MYTTDFYFTNKLPSNIAVRPQGTNNNSLNADQAEAADPTFFAVDPLQPGKVRLHSCYASLQPRLEPEPSIITGLQEKLQQSHDQQVDMLRGLGVDAYKVYKEKRVERVVSRITPGTKVCKFCNKVLKNTQKLRSHIRSHHSKGEAYECSVCSKKVGNAFALKVHMCLHESDGKKHQCHVCGKKCLTLSKLNEHASKHSEDRLTCAWCNKSFSEKKGLQDHHNRCKKRPGYEDLSWEETHPFKCRHCYCHLTRDYDPNCHSKKSHPDTK